MVWVELRMNWFALAIASIVCHIFGGLFYGPLFGAAWRKSSGISFAQFSKRAVKDQRARYVSAFLITVFVNYGFAWLIQNMHINSLSSVISLSWLIFLGFVATVQSSTILWEGKSFHFFLINSLHRLGTILIGGIVYYYMA